MPVQIDYSDNIKQSMRLAEKKKVGKHPVWLYPRRIEQQYRVYLFGIVKELKEVALKWVLPALPDLVRDANYYKADSVNVDGWADNAERISQEVKLGFNTITEDIAITSFVGDIGQKTASWNDKEWRKVLKATVGIPALPAEYWLPDIQASFAKQNVSLIQDIGNTLSKDIDGIVQRGLTSGKSINTITKELMGSKLEKGVFNKAKTRAKLIARDQISKLNGQITHNRQTDLGIKRYRWHTSRDERVRASHKDKAGRIYSWDNPPSDTGHPGEDYQCRCWAEAIFDGLLKGIPDQPEFVPMPEFK